MRQLLKEQQKDSRYAPFDNWGQYMTAKDLTTPEIASRANICKWGVRRPESRAPPETLFSSHDDFFRCLDIISGCQAQWQSVNVVNVNNPTGPRVKYWKLNPLTVLQEIFENTALKDKCVWEPRRVFNSEGNRVYTDMHTADFWWDLQVLPLCEDLIILDTDFRASP